MSLHTHRRIGDTCSATETEIERNDAIHEQRQRFADEAVPSRLGTEVEIDCPVCNWGTVTLWMREGTFWKWRYTVTDFESACGCGRSGLVLRQDYRAMCELMGCAKLETERGSNGAL